MSSCGQLLSSSFSYPSQSCSSGSLLDTINLLSCKIHSHGNRGQSSLAVHALETSRGDCAIHVLNEPYISAVYKNESPVAYMSNDCDWQNPVVERRNPHTSNSSIEDTEQGSDRQVIVTILQGEVSLFEGQWLHAHIIKSRLERDAFLGNLLICMYKNNGALEEARSVFDSMPHHTVVSWNAMIAAYSQHGHRAEAIQLFQQMQSKEIAPTKATFVSILASCASPAALEQGRTIHACIMGTKCEPDVAVGNALISMYGRCGDLEHASKVFHNLQQHNVVSWTAMITAYNQHGQDMEALQLYQQMQQQGVKPNNITFISILGACADSAALAAGKAIHASIINSEFGSDITVGNALVNMYAKCNALEEAGRVFNKMVKRNVVSWNAMISAFTQHGYGEDALQLFQQMQRGGVEANRITLVNVLGACASLAELTEGKVIHALILEKKYEFDSIVGTALVSMYGKCGCLKDARMLFDRIQKPDVVTWTAIIGAYAHYDHGKESLCLFRQMQEVGIKSNRVTFLAVLGACTSLQDLEDGKFIHAWIVDGGFESDDAMAVALINMYGKCKHLDHALSVFDKMFQHSVVFWTAMITAYVQHGHDKKALDLFQQMQWHGVEADQIALVNILGACANLANLGEGKAIHQIFVDTGFELDMIMGNALVNMYGKCGALHEARAVFDKIPQRNVVSWTAMIAAYAQHGHGKESLQLFQQMQQEGFEANDVTFVSLFSACSHAGLVDEACYFLSAMIENYGIIPTLEHYSCVIDLLGRAGRLEEAEALIYKLPVQPDSLVWTSLLGACRSYGDVARGERAAEHASHLDPHRASSYVLLSNVYAAE